MHVGNCVALGVERMPWIRFGFISNIVDDIPPDIRLMAITNFQNHFGPEILNP